MCHIKDFRSRNLFSIFIVIKNKIIVKIITLVGFAINQYITRT